MPQLADGQEAFAAALLDPALPVPAGLVGPDGRPSPRRFAVYRNNVVAGLTATLQDAFPAVHRIVGADFFRTMAGAYIRARPPRTPILLDYGAGFPDFIAGFEPAAILSYLPDIARIERAWGEAYHAPDAMPLDAAAFMALDAETLPQICLALHPSVRVVRSRHPALTIWRMNVAGGVPGPVDVDGGGEDALVLRATAEVEVRSMPGGGAAFVGALAAGRSAVDATRIAMAVDAQFDLAANLADLIGMGAFVGYGFA